MRPQISRRRPSIFVATITPGTIQTKTASNGAEYLFCPKSKFERRGSEAQTRTVMAFGPSAESIRALLVEGKPVDLAVQFDGATVKVIGEPRRQQLADPRPSTRPPSKEPEQLLLACIDPAG